MTRWKFFFDWLDSSLERLSEMDNLAVQSVLLKLFECSDKNFPTERYNQTMAQFTIQLTNQIYEKANKIPLSNEMK